MRSALLALVLAALPASVHATAFSLPAPAAFFKLSAPTPVIQGVPKSAPKSVVVAAPSGAVLTESALFDKLASADFVYVGEQHDLALHHRVQAAVLAGLHARRGSVVVGLEMFPAENQDILDDFLSGAISESEFAGHWNRIWGYPYEIYQPIFDFARANRVPVKALNAPRAVISQIARGGIDSLTPEQRAKIPAVINPIRDPRYREYVRRAFEGHGPMPPEQLAKMFEAQAVWNETMAENAMAAADGDGPVLVVAGIGHMMFGAGIAESVGNRASVSQVVVLPYPLDGESRPLSELLRELQTPNSPVIETGDYFWLLPGS